MKGMKPFTFLLNVNVFNIGMNMITNIKNCLTHPIKGSLNLVLNLSINKGL